MLELLVEWLESVSFRKDLICFRQSCTDIPGCRAVGRFIRHFVQLGIWSREIREVGLENSRGREAYNI